MADADQGIAVNKSLAWTILVAILGGGFWIGSVVSDTNGQITAQDRSQSALRAEIAALSATMDRGAGRANEAVSDLERRLRPLEAAIPAVNQRLDYIADGIRRIEAAQERPGGR